MQFRTSLAAIVDSNSQCIAIVIGGTQKARALGKFAAEEQIAFLLGKEVVAREATLRYRIDARNYSTARRQIRESKQVKSS